MMKKVLSLILVAVLLLGVLPATAFAQTAILEGYTLSLGDSIAIEFYAQEVSLADFQKIVFYKNDIKVQEITACPAAEASGRVYFKFDKLGPHEMDASIKAELYLTTSNEPVQTQTVSVLNYCTAMLSATDEKLKKLIVNMLYYGAEAETYTSDANAGIAAYIDTLDDATKALREEGEVAEAQLKQTLFKDTPTATVSWTAATLVLNAGIVPSFTFTTGEAVSGLTAVATCGGKVWRTSSFTARGTDTYSFDFTGLNPSQLRSPIYVEIRDAQDNVVSDVCAFTAEYYTAKAAEAEKALANAMMNYGSAARDYVLRDVSAGLLTADEQNALKAFAGENQMEFKNLVADAYASAGIDIAKYIPYEPWFDLADNFFYTKTVNPESDAMDYQLRTDMKAPYSYMLLPGYYGGYRHDTDKLFSADDFRVGDLFFGTYKCSGLDGWNYVAGIYQGDGKFLIYDSHPAIHTECTSGIKTEIVSDTSTMISGNADVMNKYALYYVLRPQIATRRDITSGALTQLEMDALASYKIRAPYFWYTIATEAYASAGIEADAFDTGDTFNTLRANVFSATESDYTKMLVPGLYGGRKNVTGKTFTPTDLKVGDIIATATAKCANGSWTYLTGLYIGDGKFQVSKRCCNKEGCSEVYMDTYGVALTNGMTSFWSTAEQLEAAYEYYFVLRPERLADDALQGISMNKTTLELTTREYAILNVVKNPADAAESVSVTWNSSAPTVATVDQSGKVTAVSAGEATITASYAGYTATCVVTVSNRNITSGALGAAELAAIAEYQPNGGDQWYTLATEAYDMASINVDAFNTNIGFNDLRAAVFSTTESDYTKMLVPGYYGGSSKNTGKTFTPAELKVGDIFCTAYGNVVDKCEGGSWRYVTALYVGNGTFRVNIRCCTTGDCVRTYDDVYGMTLTNGYTSIWSDANALNAVFKYYFVLRPERLAPDALQSISLNKTALTVTKLYSETLTVTGTPDSVALGAVTWSSSNPAIATVENGKVSGVATGTVTITANCGGYTATCEVTVAASRNITSGALTAEEMAAIAGYETDETPFWYTFAKAAYADADIDVEAFDTNIGFNDLRKAVFSATESDYTKMLVPGYYGGSKNVTGKIFVPADLQVGDIIATATAKCANGSWTYLTGLYIGDGTFLVSKRCCNQEGCSEVYLDTYSTTLTNGMTSFWGTAEQLEAAYEYYFVLRPARLAN